MSKFNSKINSMRVSSRIRLNKKNFKPEVVIVSPKTSPRPNLLNNNTDSNYRILNQQQSESSLSDTYLPAHNNRLVSKIEKKNDFKHDDESLSSATIAVDEHKSTRHGSDPLSIKTDAQQRRMSILRTNWAKHTTDVPYVIGANIAESETDVCGKILFVLSWIFIVLFFPISIFLIIKVVQEYERAVVFRLGRLVKNGARGPGLPCIESYTKVDMRTVSFDVPPQEVLTKDSVSVAVDAVVYYRVFNPVISIANVENSQESTRLLAQTSLRNVLGTISLADLLSNREAVSCRMREILDEATDQWGIKVERVEIKDVRLPKQLQRAMAAEAEASREARAKVIAAEGEHKSSRALKDASDILSQSPSALQLRYLQTLNSIAAEKNSTIVFPLPIEFLSNFMSLTTAKIQSLNQNNQDNLNQENTKRSKQKQILKEYSTDI